MIKKIKEIALETARFARNFCIGSLRWNGACAVGKSEPLYSWALACGAPDGGAPTWISF
ncbi:hypothetical protein [Thioclava sp. JE_KL1]|uniref:hypothetical protein n=1 Tax=Thioclava sp. JE_KL1 TaxID=2651187 RepID=UPI0013FD85D5|nr:hypothetical protein [Thioclava sp. JE_KL1]